MAQDFGIIISQPGVSVSNAKPGQISLNTSNPFIKIDTQNPVGFQTITLLITHEPPDPPAGSANFTVLYQFPHGYSYIPSIETLFYLKTLPPSGNPTPMIYAQDSITLFDQVAGTAQAIVYCVPDKTNVYIICEKITSLFGNTSILSGTTLQISSHIFVEDIGV